MLNKRGGSSGDLHGNTKTNPKTWGALEAKSAGITAALFYGFMSVASVFLNKAIFEVWKYRYPASLVAGQTIFTVCAIATLTKINVIRIGKFNYAHFRRVFPVAAVFQLKLVLDMSALVLVNIPMYGVLKSSTTPFVMLLDYALRSRVPASRVQMAVWLTTMGGFVAGCGDFTFESARLRARARLGDVHRVLRRPRRQDRGRITAGLVHASAVQLAVVDATLAGADGGHRGVHRGDGVPAHGRKGVFCSPSPRRAAARSS